MSHYTRLKTKISDKDMLLKALADMGYKTVEVHEKPTNLYGYQGDMRKDVADIIIRRKYVGGSSNDLGFIKQEDGTYGAIISDFDKARHNEGWLKKLNQRYAFHKVSKELEDMGYEVGTVVTENGKIKINAVSLYGR